MPQKKIAIVGGGISGLTTAFYLEPWIDRGHDFEIDLFESSDHLGGKIHTLRFDNGVVMESGAESFLSRKTAAIELCDLLGITQDLRGTRPDTKKTFVWHGEKMHRLPDGLSGFVPGDMNALKSTTLLSAFGKLRVGLDRFLPASKSDDDESLARFISRRIGKQAYQRLVQPLLCGIYSGDGDQLSLAATYPELRQLEKEHGSLIRGLQNRAASTTSEFPPFVTFPTGMSQLVESVSAKLQHTKISLEQPIKKISTIGDQYLIESDDQNKTYDIVVLATSARQSSTMVSDLNAKLSTVLASIPHVSTATVNLLYDAKAMTHTLDGYGFVIPSDQQNGLTAVTWTSSKHFDRVPERYKLIRGYVGRARAELDCSLSDQQIYELLEPELQRTMGIDIPPLEIRVTRWPHGSPQYTMGHCDRLAQIEDQLKQLPGIFLTGASYRGVGIPDCIRNSKLTADEIVSFTNQKSSA